MKKKVATGANGGHLHRREVEEICPAKVQVFVYIMADAYTRNELIEMEVWILAALELRTLTSTAAHFLGLVG